MGTVHGSEKVFVSPVDPNMVGPMWGLSLEEKTFQLVRHTDTSHLMYEHHGQAALTWRLDAHMWIPAWEAGGLRFPPSPSTRALP